MQPFEIKEYPDKILRKRCQPLGKVTESEVKIFERMTSTMKNFHGVGLAAPQIGICYKLIVADIGEGVVKLANPQVVKRKGKDKMVEGCLSLPETAVEVKRDYEIVVIGFNEKGKHIELKTKGLLARVLQHEIDHLKGRLIIDYMPFWDRIKFKVKKGR